MEFDFYSLGAVQHQTLHSRRLFNGLDFKRASFAVQCRPQQGADIGVIGKLRYCEDMRTSVDYTVNMNLVQRFKVLFYVSITSVGITLQKCFNLYIYDCKQTPLFHDKYTYRKLSGNIELESKKLCHESYSKRCRTLQIASVSHLHYQQERVIIIVFIRDGQFHYWLHESAAKIIP
jgi:hypothetical protein